MIKEQTRYTIDIILKHVVIQLLQNIIINGIGII